MNTFLSDQDGAGGATSTPRRIALTHLTERFHQLVLESQLPHKIVNLLVVITY